MAALASLTFEEMKAIGAWLQAATEADQDARDALEWADLLHDMTEGFE